HGQEFGYKTVEEYKKGAYEVIKNPDEVYVEKSKGKTFYIFRKGNAVVISNDDNLAIVSYYKLHRSFEERLKGGKRDGLIKIY
ncbi:MAG: hypothetical protein RMI30_06355, partial [Thermodesulfovibrio sp.]|nr:hypothetical protein [Thermodesulfovibrio sp.]